MDYITYFPPLQVKRKKNIGFNRKNHISFSNILIYEKSEKYRRKKEKYGADFKNKEISLTFPLEISTDTSNSHMTFFKNGSIIGIGRRI